MGTKWTADRDQKLFLLIVDQIKVDGNALSAAWKAKYGKWPIATSQTISHKARLAD